MQNFEVLTTVLKTLIYLINNLEHDFKTHRINGINFANRINLKIVFQQSRPDI